MMNSSYNDVSSENRQHFVMLQLLLSLQKLMTSGCRNCILITNTTQICVVVHLKGLSKVPGCQQKSPPTWLSAGYFLTTLVHHLYEISMLVPQTSIRVRKQVTCHKTLAVFSDYIAYEDAFLKA